MKRRIGFVGYDDLTLLDLAGPLEVFDTANSRAGAAVYENVVLAAKARPFVSESGVAITPNATFASAPALDTVLVAGGRGLRDAATAAPVVQWLKQSAPRIRRVASICTGVEALAQSGLLDGRRATTHWRFAAGVAQRYPRVTFAPDALFIRDGKFYTSAGVTAGIDLALALVEEDLGEKIALAVARELVVYLKRPGGQTQFSEPLQFQTRSTDRFADLAAWMIRNLKEDFSVETLASRAGLGPRHFSRRFKTAFGASPASYVERLRLDEARRRLPSPRQTVDSVAASVGYASADAFRRAFERRFGVAPSVYRKRFAAR
ncbi:MAG TPA: GlxA family transcriptional regulator [Rhizomicrobium sp.]|jgi:transcriptional regulator GlxA family with amidase domain